MRAIAYGALNPDLVHEVDRLPEEGEDVRSRRWWLSYGGKAANAAVALATWGVDTALAGLVLGDDPLGEALVAALRRPHLDLSLLERRAAERTHHCIVLKTPHGERTIVCAGYGDAAWQDLPEETWEGRNVALLDGFAGEAGGRAAVVARRRGVPVVWLDAPPGLAALADVVVWSAKEHDESEAAMIATGPVVILTHGPGPVQAWWRDRRLVASPPQTEIVDGTGAGDVFAAACARGLALGWEPEALLRWAAAAGSALAARGRQSGMPPLDEVDRLSRTSNRRS